MKRFLIALQLLTILPVRKQFAPHELRSAVAAFPLIGALQGGLLAGVAFVANVLLDNGSSGLVSALVLVALTLTNGGFHLDGFADTVDGLAGGHNPKERLKIMGDHTTGAIGVVFVVLLLILKYSAIKAALEADGCASYALLFLFPVAGRWVMVPLSALSVYAKKSGGLGAAFCGASAETLFFASAVTFILSGILAGLGSLAVLAVLLGCIYFTARFFGKRLGGITGDVLGFVSEIGEVFFLTGLLMVIG